MCVCEWPNLLVMVEVNGECTFTIVNLYMENYEGMLGNYIHARKIVILLDDVGHVGQQYDFDTKLAHLMHA